MRYLILLLALCACGDSGRDHDDHYYEQRHYRDQHHEHGERHHDHDDHHDKHHDGKHH